MYWYEKRRKTIREVQVWKLNDANQKKKKNQETKKNDTTQLDRIITKAGRKKKLIITNKQSNFFCN